MKTILIAHYMPAIASLIHHDCYSGVMQSRTGLVAAPTQLQYHPRIPLWEPEPISPQKLADERSRKLNQLNIKGKRRFI